MPGAGKEVCQTKGTAIVMTTAPETAVKKRLVSTASVRATRRVAI